MAITIKEIQVSAKVTQQKKEPDLPLPHGGKMSKNMG